MDLVDRLRRIEVTSLPAAIADAHEAADEIERLREALTPSAGTKAAYRGEFRMRNLELDESGNERMRWIDVPWPTIKEIMAACRKRAEATPPPPLNDAQHGT